MIGRILNFYQALLYLCTVYLSMCDVIYVFLEIHVYVFPICFYQRYLELTSPNEKVFACFLKDQSSTWKDHFGGCAWVA